MFLFRLCGAGHLTEEAAQQVVAAATFLAVLEQLREQAARQQVNVLGEQGDDTLEDEALRLVARDRLGLAADQVVEDLGDLVGGGPGDFRVFYDVNSEEELVVVVAVGHKIHHTLFIGDEEVAL